MCTAAWGTRWRGRSKACGVATQKIRIVKVVSGIQVSGLQSWNKCRHMFRMQKNFLEAAHCVSQTGRMLLPSEYISGCSGCRWCSRCSQHRVPVGCQKSQHLELRIFTGQNRLSSLTLLHFEREILWTKPFIVIWTRWSIPLLLSMEDQTTFSQLLFCDHLFFLHHNKLLQINVKT